MRGLAAALRKALRPPRRLKVTFEGKWFLLITLGVGAAAINTGNNLLYIALAMNLSLVVLSGILSEGCLREVSVRVRPVSEAFARRDALVAVTCGAAGKRFPVLSLRVSFSLDGVPCAARFPFVPAGEEATRLVTVRPMRRGLRIFGSFIVATRFPFSLFEKSADANPDARLLVYPEPIPSREPIRGLDAAEVHGDPAVAGRTGAFPRGVRDHAPADPVRDVHWKASARTGRLMVKEREGESAPVLDLRLPGPCPPEEFERLLSHSCAAVLLREREKLPYRLWQNDRLLADARLGRARGRALAALALASADGAHPPPSEWEDR